MKIINSMVFILTILSFFSCDKEVMEVDILIKNGSVYSGIDTIPSNHVVAIKNERIVFVGDENTFRFHSKRTIEAKGLIVCPGFIDPHTHADRDLIDPKKSHNKPFLFQGVTTVVVGNDGESFYPLNEYKAVYKKNGIGTNVISLVGHGTIRNLVMGLSDRLASKDEIDRMKELIQQEMIDGAYGISTGLYYAPGSYSNTKEVISLAKKVTEYHGIYDTHLRDESSFSIGIIPAVEEAISIGKEANLPVHISHIKCLGVDVWNQSSAIIKRIEEARNEGINVTASQYPYDASATGLKAAVVPRWAESGGKDSLFLRYNDPKLKERILNDVKKNIIRRGGSDKLLIVKAEDSIYIGKNLREISMVLNTSPEVAVFSIL
jgi:N-acyl-D-aspartate/D-glutamate deacylase